MSKKNEIKVRKITPETWARALVSGKFKQGQEQLRVYKGRGGYKHCCLGVLVELTAPKSWQECNEEGECTDYGWHSDETSCPVGKVCDAVGLKDEYGTFLPDEEDWERLKKSDLKLYKKLRKNVAPSELSLAVLNDDGFSFKEIAKVIRWRPKELFR